MGYTTEFEGRFTLDRPLKPEHAAYLRKFSETRRVRRLEGGMVDHADPCRYAVGLPAGPQGAYFVGGSGFMGQEKDASVVDYNKPPTGQPSLWCQWTPTEDNAGLQWNGQEKFYYFTEWLEYLVQNFLAPWGYVVNGTVRWRGEEEGDIGTIRAQDNRVFEEPG